MYVTQFVVLMNNEIYARHHTLRFEVLKTKGEHIILPRLAFEFCLSSFVLCCLYVLGVIGLLNKLVLDALLLYLELGAKYRELVGDLVLLLSSLDHLLP